MTLTIGQTIQGLPGSRNVLESSDGKAPQSDLARESHEQSETHLDLCDSDSSWGAGKHGTGKRRVRMRGGTTRTGFRQVNLSLLPELPLDILILIFGLLAPLDLISLAQANRDFRQTLLAHSMKVIWKQARNRLLCGVPDCPPDLTEAQWTGLLFGGTRCQECWTKNIQRPNFAWRRRVCRRCIKRHCKTAKIVASEYDISILELIPYSEGGAEPSRRRRTPVRYYWDSDIIEIAQQVAVYQQAIFMGQKGAQEAFAGFKAARIAHVQNVIEYAEICKQWLLNASCRRREEVRKRIKERRSAVYARFIELGYEERDVHLLGYNPSPQTEHELTEISWAKVRCKLEPILRSRRDARIRRERENLLNDRKRIVSIVCDEFKKTLAPIEWLNFPLPKEIYEMPGFSALINDPSNNALQPQDCAQAVEGLPALLTERTDTVRNILRQKIPSDLETLTEADDDGIIQDPDIDLLSLATTVFRCSSRHCSGRMLFTSSEVLSHKCLMSDWGFCLLDFTAIEIARDRVSFSERGCLAVNALLKTLDLHPRLTTPTTLDELDFRFVCLCCPIESTPSTGTRRRAYSWRQCIMHFVTEFTLWPSHGTPKWQLLNTEDAGIVKELEGVHPSHLQSSWSCNHCVTHIVRSVDREEVVQHVRDMHDIIEPVEGTDFFHAKPYQRYLRDPVYLPVPLRHSSIPLPPSLPTFSEFLEISWDGLC